MAEINQSHSASKRTTLNGRWKLDRSRSESMSAYLRTMDVPDMAIQAHEKGEQETDTFHTISLTDTTVKIIKRSRVNDDIVVELTIGEEKKEMLRAWSTDRSIKNPEKRPKTAIATTEDPGKHLKIVNKLLTVNGMAHVVDTKRIIEEEVSQINNVANVNGESKKEDSVSEEEQHVEEDGKDERQPQNASEDATSSPRQTRTVLVQELVITNEVTGATHTTTRYFLPFDGKLEGEDESPAYNPALATEDGGVDTKMEAD